MTKGLNPLDPIFREIKPTDPVYLSSMINKVLSTSPEYPITDIRNRGTSVNGGENNIFILPGSFLDIEYFDGFCNTLSEKGFMINGINYPGHGKNPRIDSLHEVSLSDYVHSVYHKIVEISKGKSGLYILGHSLGTIIIQLVLLIHYAAKFSDSSLIVNGLKGIVIMGGGPPKIGMKVILSTVVQRFYSIRSIMQMMNNPEIFMSEKGEMKKTVGNESYLEYLRTNGFINVESKKVMRESFAGNAYHFIPANLVKKLGLRCLFVHATTDHFVTPYASMQAISQWNAEDMLFDMDHTELVISRSDNVVSKISDWIKNGS
jgi:pimeloyl-ACP methyl ester carboxylesterase